MAGKQTGKKGRSSRRRKRRGATLTIVVMFILVGDSAFASFRLYQKKQENAAKIRELEEDLASEQARSEEISAYEVYVKTDECIEQIARDRLGLAYPNEIILKPEE